MFRRWICILLTALLLASLASAAPAWSAKWEKVVELKGEEARYLAQRAGLWSLLDGEGNILQEDFIISFPGNFENGVSLALGANDLYGYLLDTGEWLVKPRFGSARSFQNGIACVGLNGRYGYLLDTGAYLVEPCFDEAWGFVNGVARVCLDEKWGYLLDTGAYLVEPCFDEVWGFENGVALVLLDGKYGFLMDTGAYLVEPCFDEAWGFDNGIARVCLDGKWGYLLDMGEWLVEPCFDEEWGFVNGVARVCLDGKWGYLLDTGDYLVEPQFDKAGAFFGGFAAVCLDGKWGYIDEQGQLRIEPRFDDCDNFYNGSAEVELDGLCGLIDENGAYLIEPKYYGINSFEGDYATVARQGAYVEDNGSSGDYYEYIWGVIDRTDTLVLPMEYDFIEIDGDDSVAVATLGDETQFFHLSGGTAVEVAQLGSSLLLSDYYPNEGGKVATLNEAADVQWEADAELPRLDGATALFPLYAAVVQAAYPWNVRYDLAENDPLVTCTDADRAYERLIDGSADVIFCAGPSDEQLASAEAAGVELELTPFGAEAFVFIVNADNPLEDITTEQLQGVYSGAITDWSRLGVDGLGGIVAYQRPANSASQTAMEALMGGVELMTPPRRVMQGTRDILENIEYRNLPNAIGYSFRFYCTEMVGSGVRLLSIDGIEPTLENIRSGAYPHVTTLYAVTRKDEANPNVGILLDWLTSDQGQRLVEASGYVGNGEVEQ